MKILITGGAGFIGSNYIYYQLKHHPEDEFICLDKLTYAGNLSSLRMRWNSKILSLLKAILLTVILFTVCLKQKSLMLWCNFAAESHVDL